MWKDHLCGTLWTKNDSKCMEDVLQLFLFQLLRSLTWLQWSAAYFKATFKTEEIIIPLFYVYVKVQAQHVLYILWSFIFSCCPLHLLHSVTCDFDWRYFYVLRWMESYKLVLDIKPYNSIKFRLFIL